METKKSITVSEIFYLDKLNFEENYLRKNQPVVVRNGLAALPCSKWTIDYLLEQVGTNKVTVRGRTNSKEYKVGKQYIIRDTTFKEYVLDMRSKNVRGGSSYMAVQNIRKTFPQLQDECQLPEYIGKLHNGPFLWVAHEGHYEYCHYDPDASLLMMIDGEKSVKMFSCADHNNMYPNPLGSRGKTIQSQIDCDRVDFQKFPKFSKVTCYSCQLRPGDILLIPAFWWHQVTSLTDSVSMNAFFGESGTDRYITRIMEEPVWISFKYWLLNVVEQNRQFASFERTLQRLQLCVENLLLKQFHEVAPQSILDRLIQTIKEYLEINSLPVFKGGGKNPPPLRIRGLRWR
uniref:JmjC domain-containing protein n=1 Tax=Ciona savignyi TaxID=51511 RepID=H2Z7M9_CIOSA